VGAIAEHGDPVEIEVRAYDYAAASVRLSIPVQRAAVEIV
jgi:hypothetical protein